MLRSKRKQPCSKGKLQKFSKFKVADPIWRTKIKISRIFVKLGIVGFLKSLNPKMI